MIDPGFTANPFVEFFSRLFAFGAWFDALLHWIF